jgi:hypothetical protein
MSVAGNPSGSIVGERILHRDEKNRRVVTVDVFRGESKGGKCGKDDV